MPSKGPPVMESRGRDSPQGARIAAEERVVAWGEDEAAETKGEDGHVAAELGSHRAVEEGGGYAVALVVSRDAALVVGIVVHHPCARYPRGALRVAVVHCCRARERRAHRHFGRGAAGETDGARHVLKSNWWTRMPAEPRLVGWALSPFRKRAFRESTIGSGGGSGGGVRGNGGSAVGGGVDGGGDDGGGRAVGGGGCNAGGGCQGGGGSCERGGADGGCDGGGAGAGAGHEPKNSFAYGAASSTTAATVVAAASTRAVCSIRVAGGGATLTVAISAHASSSFCSALGMRWRRRGLPRLGDSARVLPDGELAAVGRPAASPSFDDTDSFDRRVSSASSCASAVGTCFFVDAVPVDARESLAMAGASQHTAHLHRPRAEVEVPVCDRNSPVGGCRRSTPEIANLPPPSNRPPRGHNETRGGPVVPAPGYTQSFQNR